MNRSTRQPYHDVIGTTLGGKYLLTAVIGHGGMGIVCEARHIGLGKRFAIKLINKGVPRPEVVAARFRREVRAISAIESENIVQVFDAGIDEKLGLYMVMEHLAGEDLAMCLARVKRMEASEVILIGYQMARGLARAHAERIIHRDLKPANVFLVRNEDGTTKVKILDFGVSKLLEDDNVDPASETWVGKLTTMGMSVGTPQYMSPEQAQGLDLDERTDVWSMGVVLYEMLAGRPAYEAKPRAHQTIVRIVTERPAPLAEIAPWVPERLAGIVHAALQHDREARIPSCALFAELLADAMRTTFDSAPGSSRDGVDDARIVRAPVFERRAGVRAAPSSRPNGLPQTHPSGFVQVRDASAPSTPQLADGKRNRKRRSIAAIFPILALTMAAMVTGHVGSTRGAALSLEVPAAAAAPGTPRSANSVAATAPSPSLRRTDFAPPKAR